MSRKNQMSYDDGYPMDAAPVKKKKKKGGLLGRIIRRFFLLVFTVVILAVTALCLVMNLVFNGPSPAARKVLTMSLTEASATKWVPGLFMDDETVAEIRKNVEFELPEEVSDTSSVVINKDHALSGAGSEFANCPDGIYIEEISGATYNAHVMIIQDPSRVYMATSTDGQFSSSIPGTRITDEIVSEGAVAAINAGAFFDNGTAGPEVGSTPEGLLIADSKVRWNSGKAPEQGFAGFNEDNILVVAKSMTSAQAQEQRIRDGCEFGPVLIMNGVVNQEAYNSASGYNPRTAIGQRADGVVIFLCIDGRQAGSIGASYKDVIDIMSEYGAVNACNMDGGSSSVMLYNDVDGRYADRDYHDIDSSETVKMVNNYSVLQSKPRRMPNFWMVRPASEG